MLRVLRATLRHYRELILAGTSAALAPGEILEMLLRERSPATPLSLALVVHSLQVALILAATALALRAWRDKTARERALGALVEQVVVAQEEERRRVAYDVHDGVAQLVVSAKQHVDTAADLWSADPARAAAETAGAGDRRHAPDPRRAATASGGRRRPCGRGAPEPRRRRARHRVVGEPRGEPRGRPAAAAGRGRRVPDPPGGAGECAEARRHDADRGRPGARGRPLPPGRARSWRRSRGIRRRARARPGQHA